MAKYKVMVVGIMILNGTTALYGTILDETEMINADESLKGGYVDLVTGSDKKAAAPDTTPAAPDQSAIDAAVALALANKQDEIDAAVKKALEDKQAEIDAANVDAKPADAGNDLINAAKGK